MKINDTNGVNTQMGMNQPMDFYSRNIQLRQHQMEQRKEKQQAKAQGSVATSMERRAGVLESEIKNNHGSDVTKKKEELTDVTRKAQAAVYTHVDVRL